MKSIPNLLGYIPKRDVYKVIAEHERCMNTLTIAEQLLPTVYDISYRRRRLVHEVILIDLYKLIGEEYEIDEN